MPRKRAEIEKGVISDGRLGRRESRCAVTAQDGEAPVMEVQVTEDSTYVCDGTQYIDVTLLVPVKS